MAASIEPIDAGEAIPLLITCDLPIKDISSSAPPLFFGIRAEHCEHGELTAVVGVEPYSPTGLLRSLAQLVAAS